MRRFVKRPAPKKPGVADVLEATAKPLGSTVPASSRRWTLPPRTADEAMASLSGRWAPAEPAQERERRRPDLADGGPEKLNSEEPAASARPASARNCRGTELLRHTLPEHPSAKTCRDSAPNCRCKLLYFSSTPASSRFARCTWSRALLFCCLTSSKRCSNRCCSTWMSAHVLSMFRSSPSNCSSMRARNFARLSRDFPCRVCSRDFWATQRFNAVSNACTISGGAAPTNDIFVRRRTAARVRSIFKIRTVPSRQTGHSS
mmetsp:Transcript_82801/g.230313  ORF Transcript_82801/g.230313 Transcript_82801/m.230313 type:complete len:260 (-) Transcript_82801:27-806(-)